jgi:hypothetical protein
MAFPRSQQTVQVNRACLNTDLQRDCRRLCTCELFLYHRGARWASSSRISFANSASCSAVHSGEFQGPDWYSIRRQSTLLRTATTVHQTSGSHAGHFQTRHRHGIGHEVAAKIRKRPTTILDRQEFESSMAHVFNVATLTQAISSQFKFCVAKCLSHALSRWERLFVCFQDLNITTGCRRFRSK